MISWITAEGPFELRISWTNSSLSAAFSRSSANRLSPCVKKMCGLESTLFGRLDAPLRGAQHDAAHLDAREKGKSLCRPPAEARELNPAVAADLREEARGSGGLGPGFDIQ